MNKLPNKSRVSGKPEWAKQISDLRERLQLNQSAFARKTSNFPHGGIPLGTRDSGTPFT